MLPLTLRGGRTVLVAPLICYDAVDPALVIAAVRRGAELIVTLSNDFWFRYGPAPHAHLVSAAFRSIETRRPQLRVTNTGISGVITATGEFLSTAGVHERATLVGTVTLGTPRHDADARLGRMVRADRALRRRRAPCCAATRRPLERPCPLRNVITPRRRAIARERISKSKARQGCFAIISPRRVPSGGRAA